eukprot:363938-Chlamydomonas_euryale.AAC.3
MNGRMNEGTDARAPGGTGTRNARHDARRRVTRGMSLRSSAATWAWIQSAIASWRCTPRRCRPSMKGAAAEWQHARPLSSGRQPSSTPKCTLLRGFTAGYTGVSEF